MIFTQFKKIDTHIENILLTCVFENIRVKYQDLLALFFPYFVHKSMRHELRGISHKNEQLFVNAGYSICLHSLVCYMTNDIQT